MKKFIVFGLIIFFSLFSISLVNAFFGLESNFDLNKEIYAPSEKITGTMDFELINQESDDYITAEVNGKQHSRNIYELLEDSNANFTCNPEECEDSYSTSASSVHEITLLGNAENYIGFKIAEPVSGITSIVEPGLIFNLMPAETFQNYCGEIPVEIDILDDGVIDWVHDSPGTYCGNYQYSSCYTNSTDSVIMDSYDTYCQKISIKPSSKLLLGADVIKITENPLGKLILFVYDPNSQIQSDTCFLNSLEISKESFYSHDCEVNFNVKSAKDYYVCISSEKNNEYRIRSEQTGEICGYSEIPSVYEDKVADFALYVQTASITPFSGVKINSAEFSYKNPSRDLISYIDDYLSEKYDGDCGNGKECIIPIKISSKKGVKITKPPFSQELMQLNIKHGVQKTIDYFFRLDKKPFKIQSPLQRFNISELNISAPASKGDYSLKIKIGDDYLKPANGSAAEGKKLSVANLPIVESLNPNVVFVSMETNFMLNVSSPSGIAISEYKWDFGDGTNETSVINSVMHVYENVGNYTIAITVTDEEGNKIQETFEISVKTSKEVVGYAIESKKESISKFSSILMSLPKFERDILNKEYNTDSLNEEISLLENSFNKKAGNNNSDENLYLIKKSLDELKVPEEIIASVKLGKTSRIVSSNSINPLLLSNLGAGKYKSGDKLEDSILAWQTSNLDIIIEGAVKTAVFDDSSKEDLFTLVNLELNPVSPLKDVYLVIMLPSGVSFKDIDFEKEYKQTDLGNAVGIKFSELNSMEIITLAMTGSQDLVIDVFASPDFDALEIVKSTNCGNTICDEEESYRNCPEDCTPAKITFTLISLILLGGALGAFLIWKFYAAVYDLMLRNKLFSTKEDYINLLIYISHRLKLGYNAEDIRKTLEKAGWSKKQLDFAFRKSIKSYKKIKKAGAKVL